MPPEHCQVPPALPALPGASVVRDLLNDFCASTLQAPEIVRIPKKKPQQPQTPPAIIDNNGSAPSPPSPPPPPPPGPAYGTGVDVWALGVLCYELIYGRSLFFFGEDSAFETPEMVEKRIVNPKWPLVFPEKTADGAGRVSQAAREFMRVRSRPSCPLSALLAKSAAHAARRPKPPALSRCLAFRFQPDFLHSYPRTPQRTSQAAIVRDPAERPTADELLTLKFVQPPSLAPAAREGKPRTDSAHDVEEMANGGGGGSAACCKPLPLPPVPGAEVPSLPQPAKQEEEWGAGAGAGSPAPAAVAVAQQVEWTPVPACAPPYVARAESAPAVKLARATAVSGLLTPTTPPPQQHRDEPASGGSRSIARGEDDDDTAHRGEKAAAALLAAAAAADEDEAPAPPAVVVAETAPPLLPRSASVEQPAITPLASPQPETRRRLSCGDAAPPAGGGGLFFGGRFSIPRQRLMPVAPLPTVSELAAMQAEKQAWKPSRRVSATWLWAVMRRLGAAVVIGKGLSLLPPLPAATTATAAPPPHSPAAAEASSSQSRWSSRGSSDGRAPPPPFRAPPPAIRC